MSLVPGNYKHLFTQITLYGKLTGLIINILDNIFVSILDDVNKILCTVKIVYIDDYLTTLEEDIGEPEEAPGLR